MLLSLEQLDDAAADIEASSHVRRTQLVSGFPVRDGVNVVMKLESTQNAGSFKIRGFTSLFCHAGREALSRGAVTMSAGNAGRSFSYLVKLKGIDGVVVMPDSVPKDRGAIIESLGSRVVYAPMRELQAKVDEYIAEGRFFAHPFDDKFLIAGHSTVAREIIAECPQVDVILVCCGGGGLVAGCAAYIKLSGHGAKVIAVEPEGAPTLKLSLAAGSPQKLDPSIHSTMAHGLAAPFTGTVAFEHAQAFVDEVCLVTDAEMSAAAKAMYG